MKSSAKKIELASVDDLFSTEEGRQDAKLEKIQEIPLSELHPFKNHPFKVKDDEAMMETADSIKQYGVLVPAISQAQRLKKYSQEGHLTLDMMRVIMGEEKKSDLDRVTFTSDTLRKYFPKSYTPQRMQETIIKLLEAWQKKRQRDQER